MKTAIEIIRSKKYHFGMGTPKWGQKEIEEAMEEYASQFKNSLPITEEEIEKIINEANYNCCAVGVSSTICNEENCSKGIERCYFNKQAAKEIKDRLQSDVVVFHKYMLINYRLTPHSKEDKYLHVNLFNSDAFILDCHYKTAEQIYNSEEFKDYVNKLKK